jgi:hypothetical protein
LGPPIPVVRPRHLRPPLLTESDSRWPDGP